MRVRAKRAFRYDNRELKVGDEVEMPEAHAKPLAILDKVENVGDEIIDSRPRYHYGRRDMRADK